MRERVRPRSGANPRDPAGLASGYSTFTVVPEATRRSVEEMCSGSSMPQSHSGSRGAEGLVVIRIWRDCRPY